MASRFTFLLSPIAFLALTASPALAQIQTGSISVRAVDEQGAVMPGTLVTITSPVLPREITGTTDAGGVYQVPGLAPGIYTVRMALEGFRPVIREDVIVRQGQAARVDITMKVGGLQEAVTVKGESPVVDVKTPGSKVNIDAALLKTTPGGKDIWNTIEYKAPGVVVESPDVGGNQGGLQRSMSSRGTGNAQNTQMLNGVNVNDPAAQGFAMYYYVPTTLENIQVSTGAQDIAVGTGGVFINMVSKSGSNRFTASGLQTYQGDKTESTNIDTPLLQAGLRPNANSTALLTNTNVQAGGPLVRNKLFYFGSANYQATHVNVANFPAVVPPYVESPLAGTSRQDTTNILAGEGKITYQPGGRHRFEGFLAKQRYDKPNRGAGAGSTQDSDSKELDTFVIAQLAYNVTLSDRMFVDSKVSYNNTHFPLYQKTALQPLNDDSTNVLFRNRNLSQIMFRRRLQVVSNFQYFLPEFLGGRHELKAGLDNGYTPEDVDNIRVDDVNLAFRSLPAPRASTVTIFNSPLHLERAVTSTALYAGDSYSVGRLNLFAGVRWERIEGYLPAQSTTSSRYFPEGLVFRGVSIGGVAQDFTVRTAFEPVRHDPLWHDFGPRFAATYDVTGRGRTVVKASWGRYLDQINTGTPPNPNASISQRYAWNDLDGDLQFQPGNAAWDGLKYVGGEFGALQQTSNLAVSVFDRSVRRPSRQEISVALDHEAAPGLLLSVAYLRTREHDVQGSVDQNIALWDQLFTPVPLRDPGRDGVQDTSDDGTITVYEQNSTGTVTSPKVINDDRLATRYDGIDLVATRRYSGRWTLLAGYTYSHTKVDLTSLANPNAAFVNAKGESGGRRHNFKASGSYELPYQIELGANFRLQSGLPITRTWQIPSTLLRQGQVTINAEPRGSVELPWLPTLDVRAGRYFRINGQRLDLSVDVYNLTNANTVWGVRTTTGLSSIRVNGDPAAPVTQIASFQSPTQVLSPRVLRVNVGYNFGGK